MTESEVEPPDDASDDETESDVSNAADLERYYAAGGYDPDDQVQVSAAKRGAQRDSAPDIVLPEAAQRRNAVGQGPRGECAPEVAGLLAAFMKEVLAAGPARPDQSRHESSTQDRLAERRRGLLGRGIDSGSGAAKTQSSQILDIALSAIDGHKIDNVRLMEDEKAFSALCASLESQGQLHPIVVAPHSLKGRYVLVAGFRRYRAVSQLGWPTIRATVVPAGTSEEALYFINAAENAQRFKLSDFEIASRAQVMASRFGTSLAAYAREIGVSESRIQNLVRYLNTLPPDILEAWRNRDQDLTDHLLQKLATMRHDEASQHWAGWKSRLAAMKRAEHSDDELNYRRRSRVRPTDSMLARLQVTIERDASLDEPTRTFALKIVEFCSGYSTGIPGIFEPLPKRKRRNRAPSTRRASDELELPVLDR